MDSYTLKVFSKKITSYVPQSVEQLDEIIDLIAELLQKDILKTNNQTTIYNDLESVKRDLTPIFQAFLLPDEASIFKARRVIKKTQYPLLSSIKEISFRHTSSNPNFEEMYKTLLEILSRIILFVQNGGMEHEGIKSSGIIKGSRKSAFGSIHLQEILENAEISTFLANNFETIIHNHINGISNKVNIPIALIADNLNLISEEQKSYFDDLTTTDEPEDEKINLKYEFLKNIEILQKKLGALAEVPKQNAHDKLLAETILFNSIQHYVLAIEYIAEKLEDTKAEEIAASVKQEVKDAKVPGNIIDIDYLRVMKSEYQASKVYNKLLQNYKNR